MTKRHKPLSSIIVPIRDRDWTISLYRDSAFISKFGDTDVAFVDAETFVCNFRTHHLKIEHIRHEVFHIFHHESLTTSSELNGSQTEELSCSIYGKYEHEIAIATDKIIDFLLSHL